MMASEAQALLEPGQRVGRWIAQEQLGAGGIGAVFAATPEGSGPRVAIKVLHEKFTDDNQMAARFRREEAAIRAISHPNVVRVFEYMQLPDSHACIVMEYLPGSSLLSIMRKQPDGRMPPVLACQIFAQIADGVAAAHEKRIVHRDLKPSNVVGVPDERREGGLTMKVLDFGIAKAGGSEFTQIGTKDGGAVMGTPPYMAPEQFLTPSKVDGRADVYSVGVMLFRALSGKLPFIVSGQMSDVQEALAYFRLHSSEPVPVLPADVPDKLAQLTRSTLEKEPARRPTMAQLADALRRLQTELVRPLQPDTGRAEEAATVPIAMLQKVRQRAVESDRGAGRSKALLMLGLSVVLAAWAVIATILLLRR